MKIGVCTAANLERLKQIKDLGYDYVELNCKAVARMTFSEMDEIKAIGIPALAANCFIDHKVVGPERNDTVLKEYVELMFSKCSYLGIKYCVYGSSGSRKVLEGMTKEEGQEQVLTFLRDICAPLAEKYDITVVIEPLRTKEDNCINTVLEGAEICKKIDHPRIKVLADLIHMYYMDESFDTMPDYKGVLVHGHTCTPCPPDSKEARVYPAPNDGYDQDSFMLPLIASGCEHCSIEASAPDFEKNVVEAYEVLKKYQL